MPQEMCTSKYNTGKQAEKMIYLCSCLCLLLIQAVMGIKALKCMQKKGE